jgi:hypothetical protein
MVDFRLSKDGGKTWAEPRLNGSAAGNDNLFGETAAHNSKVKFGAPHWVDFGMEQEHSRRQGVPGWARRVASRGDPGVDAWR